MQALQDEEGELYVQSPAYLYELMLQNFVFPRDIARMEFNGASRIPEKLRAAVICCSKIDIESPAALVRIQRELSALGYIFNSFAEAMGQSIKDIG